MNKRINTFQGTVSRLRFSKDEAFETKNQSPSIGDSLVQSPESGRKMRFFSSACINDTKSGKDIGKPGSFDSQSSKPFNLTKILRSTSNETPTTQSSEKRSNLAEEDEDCLEETGEDASIKSIPFKEPKLIPTASVAPKKPLEESLSKHKVEETESKRLEISFGVDPFESPRFWSPDLQKYV